MTAPQGNIFIEGARYHHALEYTATADTDVVRAALRRGLAGVNSDAIGHVVAFGDGFWRQLSRTDIPMGLMPFSALEGPRHSAPATQTDILIWLHGDSRDDVMDGVMALDDSLCDVAERTMDQPGFVYHDSRDLTGFVDGSANPKDDDRLAVALVADGQPGAGGAFVLCQKWVHDLPGFLNLDERTQEQIIGRTKADSIELEGAAMPSDSHVSRTDLKVDGVAMKMYRRSFPYGTASEKGLYFLAFSCDPFRFQVSLESMYGLTDDGVSDQLLAFSKAVSGSYAFAPSQQDLKAALV